MRRRFDARALQDLERIHAFISRHDRVAASNVIRRIERSINRLLIAPLSGGLDKSTGAGCWSFRDCHMWSCIVFETRQSTSSRFCTPLAASGAE
jgi:plasmid stabilization system protein ParE